MDSKAVFDAEIGEQYGIIKGSTITVFIKAGRGGSIYGRGNKYLDIARQINLQKGYTVIISANPPESESRLVEEIAFLRENGFALEEIYYVGMSNGANIGARFGYLIPEISRMLLINGPLMINWPQIKHGIESFQGSQALMVYGEKDPSFSYFGLLELIKNPCFQNQLLTDIDHNFTNHDEDFKQLIINFVTSEE